EARFYLRADVDVLGAAGRSEGHVDGHVLFGQLGCVGGDGREVHGIDETEVDDVDGNLGVVATLQGAEDILFGDWGHGFWSSLSQLNLQGCGCRLIYKTRSVNSV